MNLGKYRQMNEEEKRNFFDQNDKDLSEQCHDSVDELYKLFGPDAKNKKTTEPKEYPELDLKMSAPEMSLFKLQDHYFATTEELKTYCVSEGISPDKAYLVEYIRFFAGRTDVIKKVGNNGKIRYLTEIDEDGYGIYNHERSYREQEYIWEFSEGSIAEIYEAFRSRGVEFEEDVYSRIEAEKEELAQMCNVKNKKITLNNKSTVGSK